MKLKLKLPGAASQAPSGQAEPSSNTFAPSAQPTASAASTPNRKRKELSTAGGLGAESVEQPPSGPPLKRPAISASAHPPAAGASSMAPPRLKIALPGARAAAAAAAPRLAAAAPSPAAGPGPGSTQAGQAPLPPSGSGASASARAASVSAAATAKGRLTEEARQIAMQVNQAYAGAGGGGGDPAGGAEAATAGGTRGAGGGGLPKPAGGPGPPAPPQLVAPLPSGEGPPIKKIKLSVKMPNLASLAARIARGEPTGPEEGAAAAGGPAGAGKAGGPSTAGAAGDPLAAGDADGSGVAAAASGAQRPGAAAAGGVASGPPRLPFKLKIPILSGAGSGAGGGGGSTAITMTTKPMITTTRPAVVTTKPAAAAASGLDDDEEEDYGPDPDFALPRRGRGRGRGRGTRGAAAAGRGAGGGIGAHVSAPSVSRGGSVSGGRGVAAAAAAAAAAAPGAAAAAAAAASRGRGRSSDAASRFDLERCFEQIVKQDKDGLFAKPVTDEVAPGYSEMIKNPIDLSVIRERLRNGNYDTWGALEADLLLMTNNAKTYNPEGSTAWWHADLMEKMSLKYISCGRAGLQNYRGVAASVWRDLRKPAEGATAIPLLPRYTSAGPRLDKNGNERDPAERRRQQQEPNSEAASLMLESRLRERRPGPGALRDDVVVWPSSISDPRVGVAGVPGAGVGSAVGAFGAGSGPSGPGRRKHRSQGIRMIEADARRLMAAQAGDNRFSYRSKPPMSVAPFVNIGGLANGVSPEGLPYAIVRPSLQPAYLPCDSVTDAYATSLARFMSKCGIIVQAAVFKRIVEPPPPPPPDPSKLAQEALQQQQQQQQHQVQQQQLQQQQVTLIQQATALQQQQQQQQLRGVSGQTALSGLTGQSASLPLPLGLPLPQQPQQLQQPASLPQPSQTLQLGSLPQPGQGQNQCIASLPLPALGAGGGVLQQPTHAATPPLVPQTQQTQQQQQQQQLNAIAGVARTPTPPPLQQQQQRQSQLSGGLQVQGVGSAQQTVPHGQSSQGLSASSQQPQQQPQMPQPPLQQFMQPHALVQALSFPLSASAQAPPAHHQQLLSGQSQSYMSMQPHQAIQQQQQHLQPQFQLQQPGLTQSGTAQLGLMQPSGLPGLMLHQGAKQPDSQMGSAATPPSAAFGAVGYPSAAGSTAQG